MDRKPLGLPILISLVVGNMIGTGIYILPAALAEFGSISLLAWIFTSIGALLLALTLAHLSMRFPKTGGPYVYCKEAFGRLGGFLVAYTYWMGTVASIAGIAVASVGYLGFITPVLNANTPFYNQYYALFIELGIVWLFTIINIITLHTAGVVQVVLTIIKIIPLVLVAIVGFSSIHFEYLTNFASSTQSGFSAFGSAAALTLWAFIGIEAATIPAENTRSARDIYLATVFGTLITAVIYISSTFVLMGMIPSAILKNSQFPFAQAGTQLFGPHAATLIALCAMISGLGALNASVLIQGQIVFAAARDRLLPAMFAKLSTRGVPVKGQLFSSVLVSGFLILTIEPTLLKQFDNIALLASLLILVTYTASTLADLKLNAQSKLPLLQVICKKTTIITLLAAAYSLWMISSFDAKFIGICCLIILCCIPVYMFALKKQEPVVEIEL